jgi:D-aminoacyl-tRNA deacylase
MPQWALMIALIQRVTRAEVRVGERILGAIELGIAALVGVRRADEESDADRLVERMLGYRIFPDPAGRMNLDLGSVGGGLLLVPQFTLAADTARGMRPGFSTAAPPDKASALFTYLVQRASERHRPVGSGAFGAQMQLSLINDGPVTFWLET